MKTALVVSVLLLTAGLTKESAAQSTTGGRSGGSTASTGAGYLTPGKRPAETNPASMSIADEGASRAYMYVPPTKTGNRASSPDGSTGSSNNQKSTKQAGPAQPATKPTKSSSPQKSGAQ